MTAVHSSLARLLVAVRQFLTAIGRKNRPAILFQRRRDAGLFPAIGEKGATQNVIDLSTQHAIDVAVVTS